MSWRQMVAGERGAALVMVLLLMVIVFSLVTAMLVRTSSEVVIAGRYRDGTQALELAQGGLEEAVRRLEAGNPSTEFTASFSNAVQVRVIPRAVGAGGSIVEVQADATVGLARRRLSLLLLQIIREAFSNITFGRNLISAGSATVESGDVYSQTFVRYKTLPEPGSITYAGWRISKQTPNAIGYCYTPADAPCSDPQLTPPTERKWFPGHRRSLYDDDPLDPVKYGDSNADGVATVGEALNFTCPSGPASGRTVSDAGWKSGDTQHDKNPNPNPPGNGMNSSERLYGCTDDLLPYMWIREEFTSSDGTPPANPPKLEKMWFKVVSFDQWLDKYYEFDEKKLEWKPKDPPNPETDASRGIVPPPPPFAKLKASLSADETFATVAAVDSFGTCVNPDPNPPYKCGSGSVAKKVLLDNGNPAATFRVNANIDGHGVLLVNGNLMVNGNLTYHGTIVVNGDLTIASGSAEIFGGLVGNARVEPSGDLKIFGGDDVATTPPIGESIIKRRAWFER